MHVPLDVPLATWIRELMQQGKMYVFYNSPEWKALRASVLRDHAHECEACAAKGTYTRADVVHHEFEVKRNPGMALTRWVDEPGGTRREVLHPLCDACHNDAHDRYHGSRRQRKRIEVTEERWD